MTSKGDGERSQKQRMIAGELYRTDDPELVAAMRNAELLLERFNGTSTVNAALRAAIPYTPTCSGAPGGPRGTTSN